MRVNRSYTKEDVNLAKAFLTPAVKTYQLSEEAYKAILITLKLFLDKKQNQDKENYLTPKEACKILKITKPTLYRFINSGKLRKIKMGRSTRILESDVNKMMLGGLQ